MLTLEDNDVAIKRAEQYLHHNDGAGAAVTGKVAFKADVSDAEDPDAKFAAMEKKIQALQAQLRGDAAGAKRGHNGVPVQKKSVPVCRKEKGGCGKRVFFRLLGGPRRSQGKDRCRDGTEGHEKRRDRQAHALS